MFLLELGIEQGPLVQGPVRYPLAKPLLHQRDTVIAVYCTGAGGDT